MTFNAAAWAIDGATINSALARTQAYAANSGDEGIVQFSDLKVSQLTVPGQGLLISAGSALILNRYQGDDTDQMYTVTNPASHTVLAEDMPDAVGAAKSYILAIVIGDHEFSQAGHPWMGSDDPPAGEEDTFVYVRPTIIEVASGATSLDVDYPAIPLARIDIPASTTTVTNAMIHDLRKVARPRTQMAQGFLQAPTGSHGITYPGPVKIAGSVLTVDIPKWAAKAKIQGFVEGLQLYATGSGKLSAYIESNARGTNATNIVETAPANVWDRKVYNVGGELDVSDLQGTTQTFSVRGEPTASGDANFLKWDGSSSVFLAVFFEEQPL